MCVFVVTWVLHAYQSFWLRGDMLFSWPDSLFWGILGALVVVNLLLEQRKKRTAATQDLRTRAERGVKIAATLLLISTLWSLWNATSVGEWLEVMAWWRRTGS